jgi:dihydrofolate reductase
MPVDWRNTRVHAVNDDRALVEDVQRLKRETQGTIISYGEVRFARSLLRLNLLDELHLDVCPVILGEGQALFTSPVQRKNLRLRNSARYESGAMMMQYEVGKA